MVSNNFQVVVDSNMLAMNNNSEWLLRDNYRIFQFSESLQRTTTLTSKYGSCISPT